MSMTVFLEKFNQRGKTHPEDLWAGVLDSIGEKRHGTPPPSSVLLAVDEVEPASSHFCTHSGGGGALDANTSPVTLGCTFKL